MGRLLFSTPTDADRHIFVIIIYSFNLKLTSATFNNASTRYITNPKACKRKRLIVCPNAKNNFNETYFQKLSLQTKQMAGFMAKNIPTGTRRFSLWRQPRLTTSAVASRIASPPTSSSGLGRPSQAVVK